MGALTTAVVGLNVQCLAPGPVGSATADQVLIINLDAKNTVNLGSSTTNLAFPLGPQSSLALNAPVYAAAATMPLVVGIAPGGISFFQPASLANIGGSKVYVQDTAPTGNIPANSIWFNTAASSLETWDGTEWVTEQFSAQELIQDSTILAAQIADGTLTAAQLAAAAGILGSQIASATITSGNIAAHTIVAANIAANTIVAANIAANTITASQLAAGIVYAGIVNSTTINAATFTGSTFEGTNWVENSHGQFLYSGTPAAGNLVFSIANASGNDSAWTSGAGNNYSAGVWAYNASGGGAALINDAGEALLVLPPAGTAHANFPPQVYSTAGNAGLVNEYQVGVLFSGEETSHTGNAAVQVFSESNDGTGEASGSLVISGNQVIAWTAGGVGINQPIAAVAGTTANPTTITNGSWVAASSFGSGWGASGDGVNGVFFRLGTDGNVYWIADVHTTSATPGVTICSIPAAFVPAASVVSAGPIVPTPSGSAFAITAASNGEFQATVPQTTGIRYAGGGWYPPAGV